MVSDAVVAVLAGLASVHDLLAYTGSPDLLNTYLVAIAIGTAIILIVFRTLRLYEFDRAGFASPPVRVFAGGIAVSLFALTAVAFGLRMDFLDFPFARTWLISWFVLAGVGIVVARLAVRRVIFNLSRAGRLRRNIAIVGSGEQAALLLKALRVQREPWNSVVGVFDERKEKRESSVNLGEVALMGGLDELIDLVRQNAVDDIVIALPWSAGNRLIDLVAQLDDLPVDVNIASDLASHVFPRSTLKWLSGVAVLDVVRKPLSGWRAALKNVEDKVIACGLIILLSPVMLAVALAVRLNSPGPILFRQQRYGFNNRVFHVYKFRSMYHNRGPEEGTPQATRSDPRVTRVGAFIRKTSLDELPQLFNVLEGTMSLVGPRPHAIDHNRLYGNLIDSYFARHKMKPGITGWAQVNGLRGETDTPEKMEARVKYDLQYIENWSIWLDFKILVMTAFVVLAQDKAY